MCRIILTIVYPDESAIPISPLFFLLSFAQVRRKPIMQADIWRRAVSTAYCVRLITTRCAVIGTELQ
jgi:hypothetical protein